MSDGNKETKKVEDSELEDLMNSALQDMTKKEQTTSAPLDAENPQNLWSEEFIKEAAAQFENNMSAIISSFSGVPEDQITQEQISQTFSKMAEAAQMVLQPPPEGAAVGAVGAAVGAAGLGAGAATGAAAGGGGAPKDKAGEVSEALSATLQDLNLNAENLNVPFTEQDLANMFSNINVNESQESNMFLPFMQGMMQSLLSKEVLYPSLRELVDKYPAWLAGNKDKIPQEDYDRYCQQKALMDKVCAELEPEQESDPEEVKRKRFETVLELMQKMQDLGQPPSDLVGDIGSAPAGFAVPPALNDANQCSVM